MTLEQALTKKLEAVTADLLSDRIYPDAAPQREGSDEPPPIYLLYQHSGDDNLTFLGGCRSDTRIDTFTLELWGTDRLGIERAKDLIYSAFSGANCQGWWGGSDSGVWVQGATANDASADAVPPAQGDEETDRAERLTLRIVWTRATGG